MHKLSYVLFLLLLTTLSLSAQVEDVKRITKELSSEKYHGRGYVQNGDGLAAAFIKNEYQQIGLKQLVPDYYQHFSFPVNTFPNAANFSIGGKILKVGEDISVDPSSPSFHDTLRYRIIEPKEILNVEELIPIIQQAVNKDHYNALAIRMIDVHPDTLKLIRDFKYELAQFIPVVIITNTKFTWSVSKKQITFPIIEIQESVANGQAILVDLDAIFKKDHSTQNVIGYLPAKKKSKKTIVFTAHYDHLGKLGPATYYGANDNASGVGMLLSMARYYAQHPSKEYNFIFIAFAGEEIGLLGSKHYVEQPIQPLKEIQFLINLDLLGSGEDGITVVNGSVLPNYFNVLTAINTEKQLLKTIKPRGYAANSDHYWFTDAGVPAFFIYTMGAYKHYHDIYDQYEALTFPEINDIQTLLVEFVSRLKSINKSKNSYQ